LKIRSIGVAKRLLGSTKLERIGGKKIVRMDGETVGVAIEFESGLKPIYVSIGNLISLEDAVEVVRRCLRGSRLPEPLQRAHEIASRDRELERRGRI